MHWFNFNVLYFSNHRVKSTQYIIRAWSTSHKQPSRTHASEGEWNLGGDWFEMSGYYVMSLIIDVLILVCCKPFVRMRIISGSLPFQIKTYFKWSGESQTNRFKNGIQCTAIAVWAWCAHWYKWLWGQCESHRSHLRNVSACSTWL